MLHSAMDTGCCRHGTEPHNSAEGGQYVCRRRTVSFPKTLSSEWNWLVGYLRTALFWVVKQRVAIVSYVSGQPVSPILRGRESKDDSFWIGCSERSVRNYHYSLRDNPEERSSQLLYGGRLKSHTVS